jgi:hypothetical protein
MSEDILAFIGLALIIVLALYSPIWLAPLVGQ